MATRITDVFRDPDKVVAQIVEDSKLPFIAKARVLRSMPGRRVKLKIWFRPWAAMAAEGYPVEVVRVEAAPDGQVEAYPLSATPRRWQHRNPRKDDPRPGPLCLYFPQDPAAIKWSPETGTFEELLGIISRHLQAEEYHRRYGHWPWEDAPHGMAALKGPRSKLMRKLASRRAG